MFHRRWEYPVIALTGLIASQTAFWMYAHQVAQIGNLAAVYWSWTTCGILPGAAMVVRNSRIGRDINRIIIRNYSESYALRKLREGYRAASYDVWSGRFTAYKDKEDIKDDENELMIWRVDDYWIFHVDDRAVEEDTESRAWAKRVAAEANKNPVFCNKDTMRTLCEKNITEERVLMAVVM